MWCSLKEAVQGEYMSGKQMLGAFAAGFVAGILIYLYDVTIGPTMQSTLAGAVNSVGGKAQ